MATKTFDELKQLAIQIRDEKTNKQNTANRVGAAMLEAINKLEQDYYDKTNIDEQAKNTTQSITNLNTKIDNRTTEYNVSVNNPTSGTNGGNKYDLSTAIAQVPSELRSSVNTVSFLNEDGKTEKWEFAGGSWVVGSFSQVGAEIINELEQKGSILLDINYFLKGKYIDTSGVENSNTLYYATDYLPVKVGMKIICNFNIVSGSSVSTIACYDESKSFLPDESIKGNLNKAEKEIINENIKYVRITSKLLDDESVVITGIDNLFLNTIEKFKEANEQLPFYTIDLETEVENAYINSSGTNSNYNGLNISTYVRIKGCTKINLKSTSAGNSAYYVNFYNEGFERIYYKNNVGEYEVPEDAVWGKFSFNPNENKLELYTKTDSDLLSIIVSNNKSDIEESEKTNREYIDEKLSNIYSNSLQEAFKISDYSEVTNTPTSPFGYILEKSETIIIKKIHAITNGTTLNIRINNELRLTIRNLTTGLLNDIDVDLKLNPSDTMTIGGVCYKFDNNSPYKFSNFSGSTFAGYMSYWIEYDTYIFAQRTAVENVEKNLSSNLIYGFGKQGKSALIKHWVKGEETTNIITSGFTGEDNGLKISTTETSISSTSLSIQTNYLKLLVTSQSEFQIRAGEQSNVGCKISFVNNKITDLTLSSSEIDIPSGFLIDGENEISVNFIEDNENFKVILTSYRTSEVVELVLKGQYNISQRGLKIKSISGDTYIIEYKLFFPTDIDVIFTGDSITE